MSLAGRLVVAIVAAGAIAAALYWLSGPGTAAAPLTGFQSALDCRSCHQAVYDEWHDSHHRIAFTNPEVRLLSDDFRKEECMPCHLPRPIAETGFANRTLARRTHFDEGVHCIACHQDKDGGIMARNDRPDAPCKPRRNDDFISMRLCESCHNQHQTTDQWRDSSFARQGIDCNTCHMPEVERVAADGTKLRGRGHRYLGAHDKPTLQAAATFTLDVEGGEVVLKLHNHGAGHNFPTEERHRAVDMMYRFELTDGGWTEWTLAWRGRQPYRDEVGENTQLPAGQTATARAAIPVGAKQVEGRLWYRLAPYIGDDDPRSMLLFEQRRALP